MARIRSSRPFLLRTAMLLARDDDDGGGGGGDGDGDGGGDGGLLILVTDWHAAGRRGRGATLERLFLPRSQRLHRPSCR